MLLEQFDVKKYERSLREEGWEAGREQGLQAGREQLNALFQHLLDDGRQEDLTRSLHDKAYQEKLLEEYHLK
jgi:hypothetical protein